jgi:UDP-N-acetylmuramate dehydrogenase
MVDLICNYPLSSHNTFGFDVKARYACLIEHEDEAQLTRLLTDKRLSNLPRLILGGGSNIVLMGDFAGVVWLVKLKGKHLVHTDDAAFYVEAAAGESWHEFVAWTVQHGYAGLENLALIPGTVGAAPIQNIGAYGLEMSEYFEHLRALDLHDGKVVELERAQCAFGYRDSLFKQAGRGRYLILSVRFRLPKAWQPRAGYADVARVLAARNITQPNARDIFEAVVEIRSAKLPDPAVQGNAGSFFKNPVISAAQFAQLQQREPDVVFYPQPDGARKLAAGWLIERAGWKGRAMGAAAVHDRQALVLVNQGGSDGQQVLALAAAIQASVRERFGVELEIEPVVV